MFSKKELYLPLLKFFSDGNTHSMKEVYEFVEKNFDLTEEEKLAKTKSGALVYKGRIGWAITTLCSFVDVAPLVRVGRGLCKITPIGIRIVNGKMSLNDWKNSLSEKYRENGNKFGINNLADNKASLSDEFEQEKTPNEIIDDVYTELNDALKNQLIAEIMDKDYHFFEELVLKLLERMGYGLNGKTSLTQKGADEGIDGIISEDELGLSKIYIQAKRWENNISRPELQKFAGAISDKPTQKGVFITTSDFSKEAMKFAKNNKNLTLVLINGNKLCELMIKYKLGVYVKQTIEFCEVDRDFFEE